MIFINVIFQIYYNGNKHLGLITYNELDHYEIYKNNNNENDAIKIIVESELNELIEFDEIYFITKYYENNIFDDVINYGDDIFNIIIDHKKQYLMIYSINYDYKKIISYNSSNDIYGDDEKEYILEEDEQIEFKIDIDPYDFDMSDINYGLKNIFNINEVVYYNDYDDYEKEEVQRRIDHNIKVREKILQFDEQKCFQKEFINKMLEETYRRINVIKYFIDKFICIDNKIYLNELLLLHASLLCKKYKYMNDGEYLKKIKYNFIVTDIYYNKDYDRNITYKINIKSINNNDINGYYKKIEYADYQGYIMDRNINYFINDIDDDISENLFNYLLKNIIWID